LKAEVDRRLSGATERQAQVADTLRPDIPADSPGWPLRGELMVHLERLRAALQPAPPRPPRRPEPDVVRRKVRTLGARLRRRGKNRPNRPQT
jgi:hypothetical protein